MSEIILAGTERIYRHHINTYQHDKFARYIYDVNSIRGIKAGTITRVILAFGWQGKKEYDRDFFHYLKTKLSEDAIVPTELKY